jgi:catechol 2,3-dioxygenase-like lactoylglutathione lyase family enzyme
MPSGLHHASVATREHDRLVGFLEAALGLGRLATVTVRRSEVAGLFGWPDGDGTLRSSVLGSGHHGLLEVVDVPDAAEWDRALPTAGVFQLSFVVDDVSGVLRRAAASGADAVAGPRTVDLGGTPVEVGVVDIAGLRLQLTRAG